MKRYSSKKIGWQGENLAAAYLESKGYQILERNYVTPFGEIDIIASSPSLQESDRLVFIEVKMRRNQRYGYPEASITQNKLNHLIKASLDYLQKHSREEFDWQIDVISIELSSKFEIDIHHFENVTIPLHLYPKDGSNGNW